MDIRSDIPTVVVGLTTSTSSTSPCDTRGCIPWLSHREPAPHLGHVGEPLQQGEHALEVVADGGVRHAVVVHDLDPPQLVVGRVHLAAQNLEEREQNAL